MGGVEIGKNEVSFYEAPVLENTVCEVENTAGKGTCWRTLLAKAPVAEHCMRRHMCENTACEGTCCGTLYEKAPVGEHCL